MKTFYNEIDLFCCSWISNLMDAGHITPGVICDSPIQELTPDDIAGYERVHFFAGIAVWDYALTAAGFVWPVWTGSCPCQPFSAAGRAGGFGDSRHLWPHWSRLIGECRPDVIFGEQVASRDGLAWLDFVCADLEAAGYAVGTVDTCAAGFGAPHIRQRLYFVADSTGGRRQLEPSEGRILGTMGSTDQLGEQSCHNSTDTDISELADASIERRQQICRSALGDEEAHGRTGRDWREPDGYHVAGGDGETCAMADSDEARHAQLQRGINPKVCERSGRGRSPSGLECSGATSVMAYPADPRSERTRKHDGRSSPFPARSAECGTTGVMGDAAWRGLWSASGEGGRAAQPKPTNGFWRNAEWLLCIDGKARAIPVESALFPLAARTPNLVGILRGAGNALCAPQAEAFIRAYMEIT